MRDDVIKQLRDLNRDFYDTFARVFARSRGATEPGLERILADVGAGDHMLDLGCGQGRIVLRLPESCTYVGVDFSAEMVALAREEARKAPQVETHFLVADLLAFPWPPTLGEDYDWIVLRAVLHHVPAFENRRQILEQAAARLAPEGRIVIANWQFLDLPRLRRRLLPWGEIGLSADEVEEDDYLLDWKREGYGLRYVHLVDRAETLRLAQAAGLEIEEIFRADGHNNDLTLYAVMRRADS
ncbi:MAG: class I SAM-dependent methyltransferase [Anaerolineae bacterium]